MTAPNPNRVLSVEQVARRLWPEDKLPKHPGKSVLHLVHKGLLINGTRLKLRATIRPRGICVLQGDVEAFEAQCDELARKAGLGSQEPETVATLKWVATEPAAPAFRRCADSEIGTYPAPARTRGPGGGSKRRMDRDGGDRGGIGAVGGVEIEGGHGRPVGVHGRSGHQAAPLAG